MWPTSSNSSESQTHEKYDNTRHSFSGRSYGVDSSVGLVGDVLAVPNLVQYSYIEDGYKADVTCIINDTSEFRIDYLASTGVEGRVSNIHGPWTFAQQHSRQLFVSTRCN